MLPVRALLLVTGLAATLHQAPAQMDPGPFLNLENDVLRVLLDTQTGAFVSVLNRERGLELISTPAAEAVPWLLRLGVRDEGGERLEAVTEARSFTAALDEDDDGGTAYELRWAVREDLALVVRAELPAGDQPLRLYPAVLNRRADTLVIGLRYPLVSGIGRLVEEPRANLLAHPVAGGFLFEDPLSLFTAGGPRGVIPCLYPNGFDAPIQFMAYYARGAGGFSFACEDPHGTVKEIAFHAPPHQDHLQAAIEHFSWDLHPGNSLRLGYPVVIAALREGDWYEAAERYRAWATGSGPGHPDWCYRGRLEDRVAAGQASRWLAEEVGFCTFGMPASIDVSPWLEAFHQVAEGPVFHIFGHDWPAWAGDPLLQATLHQACMEMGLGPLDPLPLPLLQQALAAADEAPEGERHTALADFLRAQRRAAPVERYPAQAARTLYQGLPAYIQLHQREPDRPFDWFPAIMKQANIDTLQRLGDHYALFHFDCFPYGFDLRRYGLNTWGEGPLAFNPPAEQFAPIWMDPAAETWIRFHAERDARAARDLGADAAYYDISSAAIVRSLFSNRADRLHRPPGAGRQLVEDYRALYERSKRAARAAAGGRYVPQGSEVLAEVYLAEMDFAQCRAGGGVQGDLEGIRFLDWMKQGRCRRIPLFTCVYHDYGCIRLDGWAKLAPEFGEIFYLIAAEVALEGGLLELNYEFSPLELFPGMTPPGYQLHYHKWVETVDDPPPVDPEKVAFLRAIARARTGFAREFLAYGRMIRPAAVTSEIPTLELDWKHYNSIGSRREEGVFEASAIVHCGWSYREEKLGYLFCNIGRAEQQIEVRVDPASTPLKGGDGMAIRRTHAGDEPLGPIGAGRLSLSLHLPPREIVLLELRPQADG